MANYKNLIAWQKAHELALMIYKIAERLPKHEQFAIAYQIKRAALSIPTNLEGDDREGD